MSKEIHFAAKLREIREHHNASRSAMAEYIGTTEANIKNWELENRRPPLEIAARIGAKLGYDWALYLIGFGDKPTHSHEIRKIPSFDNKNMLVCKCGEHPLTLTKPHDICVIEPGDTEEDEKK